VLLYTILVALECQGMAGHAQVYRSTWSSLSLYKCREKCESASRPLVDFGVLNDDLSKSLISCVKCISRFLMKIQMYSMIHLLKYNYEASGTM
jgi:hypothetical protein